MSGSESKTPPRGGIALTSNVWTLGFLLLGIALAGFLLSGMSLLIGEIPERDYLISSRDTIYVRFFELRYLGLIPLALLADRYLERRENMALAAMLSSAGFLMLLLNEQVPVFPSIGLLLLGGMLTTVSLLAYLGSQVKGSRLTRYGIYLLAIACCKLGSFLAVLSLEQITPFPMPGAFFMVGSGAFVLYSIVTVWAIRKGTLLPIEKWAANWVTWRSLGYTMVGVTLLIMWLSPGILDDVFRWSNRQEGRNLYIMGLLFWGFCLVLLFRNTEIPKSQRTSLAILLGSSLFIWGLHCGQAGFMEMGFFSVGMEWETKISIRSYADLSMLIIGGGVSLVWILRKRKSGGELIPIFSLLISLFVMLLIPWLISGNGRFQGGWWMICGIAYHGMWAIVQGSLYYLAWLYAPARLRMVAITVLIFGQYLAGEFIRLERWWFDSEYYVDGYYSGTASILGLIGLLTVGGLVYYRIQLTQNSSE